MSDSVSRIPEQPREERDHRTGCSPGQALGEQLLDRLGKAIDFVERRVNVWCDANALIFVVFDRGHEDPVRCPEVVADLMRVESGQRQVADRTGLPGIEAREHLRSWMVFEVPRPAVLQV